MYISDSNERRNKILESIIEAYVTTAAPVGSELIARKLRSTLSPATIRNIMVELEEAGYVEQPHTSAGRVPTNLGYRYYVDSLMGVPGLSSEQARQLAGALHGDEIEVEPLLERASEALAGFTQQAVFILAPTVKQSTVRQIELVPLSLRKILCVLVSSHEEMFASHVVELEEPLSRDEAVALVHFINTQLAGLPFNEVIQALERRLLGETDSFYHLVKRSLAILEHALSTEPNERFLLGGTSYVVAQPEFQDPKKAHLLLRGLESPEEFAGRVRQDLRPEHVQVRIGDELGLTGCVECSYVAAPFLLDGHIAGGIGILGPRRMDYPRMSAWVDGMAHVLTELFSARGRG